MVRFGDFAMYVCTGSVRTYIAKRRNSLIYRVAVPKVGTGNSSAWFRTQAVDFIGVFNLNTPTLDP